MNYRANVQATMQVISPPKIHMSTQQATKSLVKQRMDLKE